MIRTCPGNKFSPAFHFMLDTMYIVCYYYMGPGEAPGATGRLRVPEIGGSEMGRIGRKPDADVIRDNIWVNVSGKDANKIVIGLTYYRKMGGSHDAKTYILHVRALNDEGVRMIYCGRASAEVWRVATRRSAPSDSRAVSIARDYLRKLVRDVAFSCGADADKAVDDAVALADKNW